MLDVSKLQKKGNLAKEMVRLGMATDIETAFHQIEDNAMVNSQDDFNIVDKKPEAKPIKIEPLQQSPATQNLEGGQPMEGAIIAQNPNDINILMQKVEQMEKKVNDLASFVDKYKTMNDKNLQEVDTTLKSLTITVRDLKTSARMAAADHEPSSVKEKPKEQEDFQAVTKPKDDWDTSQFAVDKIFNNSHGQMMGKLK